MPSVSDLIFVCVLCILLFTALSVKLLGDAGIGWHIRTGQQILATHAIPENRSIFVDYGRQAVVRVGVAL